MVTLKMESVGENNCFRIVEFETGDSRVQSYGLTHKISDPSGIHTLDKPLLVDWTCEYDGSFQEGV